MNAKKILIANQKGGVGKSTLACYLPTLISYYMDKEVILIDSDHPQNSISKLRSKEQQILSDAIKKAKEEKIVDPILRKYHNVVKNSKRGKKPIYPIVDSFTNENNEKEYFKIYNLPNYLENIENKYDYIFIDSIGTVNAIGYKELITGTELDLVIVPTSYDDFDFDSTYEFVKELKNQNIPYAIIFTQIEYTDIKNVDDLKLEFKENNIEYFDAIFPDSKKYKKAYINYLEAKALKSTIFPNSDPHLNSIVEELILKLNK